MDLQIYPLLSRKSKNCIARVKWRWGKKYEYNPRPQLIKRLADELKMSKDQVREQIEKEREYILQYPQYY